MYLVLGKDWEYYLTMVALPFSLALLALGWFSARRELRVGMVRPSPVPHVSSQDSDATSSPFRTAVRVHRRTCGRRNLLLLEDLPYLDQPGCIADNSQVSDRLLYVSLQIIIFRRFD